MSRRPDGPPEAESAVTTIALVGETKTPWGTAAVAACLAELAVTDELVVVYGSEAHGSEANGSGPGVHTLVAELRGHLPRYTIAALYLAPYDGALGRDADLLTELVETGVLPVVVTPAGTAPHVAAEVHVRVQADRAVRVSYTLTGEADVEPVWRHRTARGRESLYPGGPAYVRRAG